MQSVVEKVLTKGFELHNAGQCPSSEFLDPEAA